MSSVVRGRLLALGALLLAYWLAAFAVVAWFDDSGAGRWNCAAVWASMTAGATFVAWIAPVLARWPRRWFEIGAFVLCLAAFLLEGLTMLIATLGPDHPLFRYLGNSWDQLVREDAIVVMIILYAPIMAFVSAILCIAAVGILRKVETPYQIPRETSIG